jgi:hypothetical protein
VALTGEPSYQSPEVAAPAPGSIRDEFIRICQAVAGLDDVRKNLHVEVERLRERLDPILDLTSRPTLADDSARPDIGYAPTSGHAGELRDLAATIAEITDAYATELRDLVWIRERIGL